MTDRSHPTTLAVPVEEARSRLDRLLTAGEQLRADAVQHADRSGLELTGMALLWQAEHDRWVGRVENALQHVFADPAAADRFRSASGPERSGLSSAERLSIGRQALQRELAVLREFYAPVAVRRSVFLVHGRDRTMNSSLTLLLQAFGLDVLGWERAAQATGRGAPTTLEIVQAGVAGADAIVVLFTPDDMAHLRDDLAREPSESEPVGQPRMNVVFEAGMAMRTVADRDRVVIIQVGRVRAFTDVSGIDIIVLDDSEERRLALAARLQTAGLTVQIDGSGDLDWRTAGSFGR